MEAERIVEVVAVDQQMTSVDGFDPSGWGLLRGFALFFLAVWLHH